MLQVSTAPIFLQHGDCRVRIDPAHGGAVREFSWRGLPIFRPTACEADSDPLAFSCFPMAPYANRIAHGRFIFRGREIRMPPNWSGDLNPIHGQAWRAPWMVRNASASQAALTFEGGGDSWPWRYRCDQQFDLGSDRLTLTLSAQNLADEAMPAILGLHPYFPDARGAGLAATLPRAWLTQNNLPTGEVPTPAAWRFAPARPVGAVPLDHSFSGWDGVAAIAWPDRTLRIHATGCDSLHVYAPAGEDFFCVEPQTAPAGALGREDEGVRVLEPGARLSIQVTFDIGDA